MGLLEIASGNSLWRGYDYYETGKVIIGKEIDKTHYEGRVDGSEDNIYDVVIDIDHPKKSICNCPHAEGTRRICKHKVALYFYFFPEEAERIVREAEEWEAQEELRIEEEHQEIKRYVFSLSKEELRQELLWRMLEENDNNGWY